MHEIYPKPPLVETVFEIKFSGEPSIDCKKDKFFQKIRKDYPKLMVPRAKEGVAIALEPYLFEKEDASYSIGLSINKLFLSTATGAPALKMEVTSDLLRDGIYFVKQ